MNREEVIGQGMRLLKEVRQDEHFKTVDGRTLKSVRELVLLLETYHDDHFDHHVNEHRNDFAAWVQHSVGDAVLADRIRSADSKQGIQRAIADRLEEIEQQLLAIEHGEAITTKAQEPASNEAEEPESEETDPMAPGSPDEIEALVGEVDETEHNRDELLEEIESAIAQAQAQLQVERAEEIRAPENLTGEPDRPNIAPAQAPREAQQPSKAERKLAKQAERDRKRAEKQKAREERAKARAAPKAQTQDHASGGFSFKDFLVGFGFGAFLGLVIGGIVGILVL